MAKNTKSTKSTKTAPAKRNGNGKAEPTITKTIAARTGGATVVEVSNGKSVVVSEWQTNKQTLALMQIGKPVAPLVAHIATIAKPGAKLANGVTPQNSPHSAAAARAAAKGGSKGRKARGDAAVVAGKPAKAAKVKRSGGRGYDAAAKLTTLVKPKASGLAEGSGRMAKLLFASKCKTVGAFLGQTVTDDSGKVHKCDAGALSGMLKRDHVRVG